MLWIRVGGGCVRVGGTVRNTLKEGRRSKDFEKKGQERVWNHLTKL